MREDRLEMAGALTPEERDALTLAASGLPEEQREALMEWASSTKRANTMLEMLMGGSLEVLEVTPEGGPLLNVRER